MSSDSFFRQLATRHPVLLHAATWTLLLVLTVLASSLAPEAAFTAAISRLHGGFIRIPLEVPGEILCVPESMVGTSDFDFLLPTVFAAIAVFGSACLLRSLGLWEEIVPQAREATGGAFV
ncbi:uncharacterized protein LOC116193904 [Punica granatum]|uniref:Uncharacterized protein LOC116193904 n=1 Tax=Punica granatum TaxID=22663 RepID=A0A6P8C4S5_PUNGR|nr:uncharacterized protein LOC116193904 [Punica granatum]